MRTLATIPLLLLLVTLSWFPAATAGISAAAASSHPLVSCLAPGRATPVSTPNANAAPKSVASAAASTPGAMDSSLLHTVADVPLPGSASRFDYQSLDPASGRLAIAHMGAGQLVVFDTRTRTVVGTVDHLPKATGVLAVPEVGKLFVSVAGDHQVAVVNDTTFKVVARVGKIGFPDGLAYAPQAKRVFVSDEDGGGELVVDARTNTVVTTIDIGGKAGNTHYDSISGCILVAVQSRNQLVAINPETAQVVGRYAMAPGCDTPHGFLIDAPGRLAFVTCEGNAKMLVVDLKTMQATATLAVGESPDVLAFDPGWHRLYVASESGAVAVFDESRGVLQPLGTVTMADAHTIAVDPDTHLIYLPLANVHGRPVLRIMASAPPAGAA